MTAVYQKDHLSNLFTYHAPKGDQAERYQRIRKAAEDLAAVVLDACPNVVQRDDVITKILDATNAANRTIACFDP